MVREAQQDAEEMEPILDRTTCTQTVAREMTVSDLLQSRYTMFAMIIFVSVNFGVAY
jgi:hypothetical protein